MGTSRHHGKSAEKVSLAERFDSFQEFWSPKIVGDLNDA